MVSLGDLPKWAVVLLCLAVAVVLALQNLSRLLSAMPLLTRQRRSGAAARGAPTAESEDRTDARRS